LCKPKQETTSMALHGIDNTTPETVDFIAPCTRD